MLAFCGGEREERYALQLHSCFLPSLPLLTMTCGTAARKRLTRPLLLACWQRRCPWPAHNMRVSLPMSFSCIQMRMVDNFTEKSISKRKIHLAAATQKKTKLSSIPCHAHRAPRSFRFHFGAVFSYQFRCCLRACMQFASKTKLKSEMRANAQLKVSTTFPRLSHDFPCDFSSTFPSTFGNFENALRSSRS